MRSHPAIQPLIFLSAGGTAIDVLGFIDDINARELRFEPLGYLDDAPAKQGAVINELPVLGTLRDHDRFTDALFVNCLGSSSNYAARGTAVDALGIPADRFATLIHPSSVVSRHSAIGAGTIVYPHVFIGSGTRIGRQALIMSHASINHEVSIGDHAIIASGVVILGKVTLGARSYTGACASVRQGLTIGADSLVGMGSVVVRDVAPGTVVVGVPAKPYTVGSSAP